MYSTIKVESNLNTIVQSMTKVTFLIVNKFLIASMECVSDLKKDFDVGGVIVVVVLDAELLLKFP